MYAPSIFVTFAVSQCLGIAAVIFNVLAVVEDYKLLPVTAPSPTADFVWHPCLMPVGMIYLFGTSIVMYRVMRYYVKLRVKVIHMVIHMVALILFSVGLYFAISVKNSFNLQHFTSIHGMFGIATIGLFVTQWCLSIPVFLWPKASEPIRRHTIGIHVSVGIGVFCSAVITAMTGFNGKASAGRSSEAGVAYFKTSAFFYVFYFLVILFTLFLNKYKRLA